MKIEELKKYFPDNANVIFTNNAEEANTKLLYRLVVASESMAIKLSSLVAEVSFIRSNSEKLKASNEYYEKRNKEQNLIIKQLKNTTYDTSI